MSEMQRTLVAEFPPLTFQTDRDGAVTTIVNNGYTNESVTGTALFYQEVLIDLSGYALEKKTFFPYSSFEQSRQFWYGGMSSTLSKS